MAHNKRKKPAVAEHQPLIEYGAPVEFDCTEPTSLPEYVPADTTEWISNLEWRVVRVEQNPGSLAESSSGMRLAIALVLGRLDWIHADGCKDFDSARTMLEPGCLQAIDRIRDRRADEQTRFAPVFQKHEVPEHFQRDIINGIRFAFDIGREKRRRVAMRSDDFKQRQKRELAALEMLSNCLEDENATDKFLHACADQGFTIERLEAAMRNVKFWQRHEGVDPRPSKPGSIPQYGRTEAVMYCSTRLGIAGPKGKRRL